MQPLTHFGSPLAGARAALVLVHGRGSHGRDMYGLASEFARSQLACVAPSATSGSWYPHRFLAPLSANQPYLDRALADLKAVIDMLGAGGIPPARIGLIGFSQGACLVAEHTLRVGGGYAFAAVLSGALIGPLDTPRPSADLGHMPILLECADHDAHIPVEHVRHSCAVLNDRQAEVACALHRGADHRIFESGIAWIRERLPRLFGDAS
jgi:phospholipase/carboxylesterase